MIKILIKNGRIWDGDRFFRGDILTVGGTIAQIADHIDSDTKLVYDAAGKTVSAGLVDLHVHMQGVSNDNIGIQAEMSSFPFGVTAACDCGAELGDETFLDCLAVKNLVFVSIRARDGIFDAAATEARVQKYGKRAVGLKVYFDTNIKSCPTPEELQKVCTYAREHGLKVMVHCSNSPASMAEIVQILNPGDILTHIFHGGVNSCTEDDFASLLAAREKGIVLDAGFAAHIHADLDKLRQAVSRGILPDTISTDITCGSAYMRGGRYGLTMCMTIARTAGMAEEDIFRAVTSVPANAVGTEWGTLREGGCADISVFDYTDEGFDLTDRWGNSMQSSTGYRCVLTVANGKIVYRD